MKKILLIVLALLFSLPTYAQVIQLKSNHNNFIEKPQVFRPTQAIVGGNLEFLVKGMPNAYVSIITSFQKAGAEPLNGINLKIGTIAGEKEVQIPENGVAKINITIPNDKELIGKRMYFEALVWNKNDKSDIELATILGADTKAVDANEIIIVPKPHNASIPGFGPALPGWNPNFSNAIDTIERYKRGESSPESEIYVDKVYNKKTPAVLRNLMSPDLQKDKNETE